MSESILSSNEASLKLLTQGQLLALLSRCQSELGARAMAELAPEQNVCYLPDVAEAAAMASVQARTVDIATARSVMSRAVEEQRISDTNELIDRVASESDLDPDLVLDVLNTMIEEREISLRDNVFAITTDG